MQKVKSGNVKRERARLTVIYQGSLSQRSFQGRQPKYAGPLGRTHKHDDRPTHTHTHHVNARTLKATPEIRIKVDVYAVGNTEGVSPGPELHPLWERERM